MERLAEVTERHLTWLLTFVSLGFWIMGNSWRSSWRKPRSYLHPCWFITALHLCPLWSPLSLLRGSGPSWTTHILLIRDRPSSSSIVLPLPACGTWRPPPQQERSSGRPCVCQLEVVGRLTPPAQPKPDFGIGSNCWYRLKRQPALESEPQISRCQIKFSFPGLFSSYWEHRKDGRK